MVLELAQSARGFGLIGSSLVVRRRGLFLLAEVSLVLGVGDRRHVR